MKASPSHNTGLRPVSFSILVSLAGLASMAGCSPPEPDFGIDAVEGFGASDAGVTEPPAKPRGPSEPSEPPPPADDDAGMPAPDAASPEPEPEPEPAPEPEPLAFGVVSSDHTSTSVSLLRPDGTLLAGDFIHSGSAPAGLVTALSGDVVLPTRSGEPEILTLIDRYRTDVITRVDPASGEVLGQVRTHTTSQSADATAYSSNPQDFVRVGDNQAWVTRFEPNTGAEEGDDRGNDLLRLDLASMERRESLPLDALNTVGEVENPDTQETRTVTVFARPSGMVRLGTEGHFLLVGLARLSAAYDAAGEGMVALVDLRKAPSPSAVTGVPLPGLQNCAQVAPVVGDASRAVVGCAGFYRGVPRDTAGVVIVALDDDELAIEHSWRAKDHPTAPLAVASVLSLGGTRVAAVAYGSRAETDADGNELRPATNDAAYLLDVADAKHERLFEGQGRYVLGTGAFNDRRGLLLMPDGSLDADGRPSGGVRRFVRNADGHFQADGLLELDDTLPPRQVRAL